MMDSGVMDGVIALVAHVLVVHIAIILQKMHLKVRQMKGAADTTTIASRATTTVTTIVPKRDHSPLIRNGQNHHALNSKTLYLPS